VRRDILYQWAFQEVNIKKMAERSHHKDWKKRGWNRKEPKMELETPRNRTAVSYAKIAASNVLVGLAK